MRNGRKIAHRLKREEKYRVTFATSIKSGLLKALERQPIEKIHNLQYDFKYLKQRAQNSGKESFQDIKEGFPYFDLDETIRLTHCYPFILILFKKTVVNKRKITLCNSSTALVFADVLSKHMHGSVFRVLNKTPRGGLVRAKTPHFKVVYYSFGGGQR